MTSTFKYIIPIIVVAIFLCISCKKEHSYIPTNLTKLSQEEVLERIKNREFPNPDKMVFRSHTGMQLTMDSLQKIQNPKDYAQDFYRDEAGEVKEIVVRPANEADKIFNDKVEKAYSDGPDVEMVEINCDDKVQILQDVFDRDQAMRRGDAQIDPNVDHQNLEVIVSFIEKCGIPTLDEINDVQMAGIWAVLQHAPNKYQSKYIPLLEKAAKNGDIKWGVIALMKDRALMYEGKPQIYGSQVSDGELYELFAPEYVNQRREEIGMDPIEAYLKRFNIEFKVVQKRK